MIIRTALPMRSNRLEPDSKFTLKAGNPVWPAGLGSCSLKRILESKSDTKLSKDAGDAIAAWGRAIPGLFAPGTDRGHTTRALPVIWSDRSGFEKAASNLTEAAQALSKAAS